MAKTKDATFSIRMEHAVLERIEKAADTIDRSRNWVINAILDKFFYEGGSAEDLVTYIMAKRRAEKG